MNTSRDSDLTLAKQLAEGFASLAQEYKGLAQQHGPLKQQLQSVVHKDAINGADSAYGSGSVSAVDSDTKLLPTRNVIEWVTELGQTGDDEASQRVSKIEQAEFALFKLRELEKLNESKAKVDARRRRSDAKISFGELEKDFTTPGGESGHLKCPFAGASKPQTMSSRRSMRSSVRSGRLSSHRLSLNDRRTELGAPSTIESESGGMCPIRFLDQHSPEEVAKYFEEHKHELPRSHEACVRRFQSDANSVKALDQKYGSLVNMIQGLGEKHQPMLPEPPIVEDEEFTPQDAKAVRLVENWASTVGEEKNEELSVSKEVDDDRQSHFDRPLKEIRVGESPSRPWGVPIPSKYYEKAEQETDVVTNDKSASPTTPQAEPLVEAPKSKGRCPFGHGAGFTGPNPHELPASTNPVTTAAPPQGSLPNTQSPPPATNSAQQHPQTDAPPYPGPPVVYSANTSPSTRTNVNISDFRAATVVINEGLALISDSDQLKAGVVDNRGTLVLGYGGAIAQEMQKEYHRYTRG